MSEEDEKWKRLKERWKGEEEKELEEPKTWDTETGTWLYVENMYPGKSYFVDCYPSR